MANNPAFNRLEIVTGTSGFEALQKTSVILLGIGGVGSWCAEALIRSGIGNLTIVDSDHICITNINRQLQATSENIGASKVDEMADRLRKINPHATISPLHKIFDKATADQFDFAHYNFVIDAIDSLTNKVDLIMTAHAAGAKVITALGASNKLDPLQIRVGSLWESQGCRLGRYVRKRLRQNGFTGNVTCVYSEENLPLQVTEQSCNTQNCMCPKTVLDSNGQACQPHEWCSSKKQINGSAVHITGTFGFILAGIVVQDVVSRSLQLTTIEKGI